MSELVVVAIEAGMSAAGAQVRDTPRKPDQRPDRFEGGGRERASHARMGGVRGGTYEVLLSLDFEI